jgi:hypothetical protein
MISNYNVSLISGHGNSFQDDIYQDSRIPGVEDSGENLKKTTNP